MKPQHAILAFMLCLGLASCGYQPLYGTANGTHNVTPELSAISVKQQSSRAGQLIRNEILSLIGKPSEKRYSLSLSTTEKAEDTAKSFDSDVLRETLHLKTRFLLKERESGKVLLSGQTFANVPYDKTAAPFSDYQARIGARQRGAKQIGQDIHTRLAAFFAKSR